MENTEMNTVREWNINIEETPWRVLNTLWRHWGGGHWKLDFNVVWNVPELMQRRNILPGHLETAHWSCLPTCERDHVREMWAESREIPQVTHSRPSQCWSPEELSQDQVCQKQQEQSPPQALGPLQRSSPSFRSRETWLPSTRHRFWAESQDGFCLFVCIFFLIQARSLWDSEALWQGPSLRHVAATGAASKDSLP